MDEDGNMQLVYAAGISEEALARILKNCIAMKKDTFKPHYIGNLTEKCLIDKFTRKTSNVS